MAYLGFTVNESELPPSDNSFDVLPPGWYTAKIEDADLRFTQSGGQMIKIKYRLDNNRVVFGNLNVVNHNAKAEEIGRRQLGELMRAIGLASAEDTDQFVGGTCEIKLKVRPAQNGYDESNDVAGFRALQKSEAPLPVKTPVKTSAPWGK